MRILGLGVEIPETAVRSVGDTTPGGLDDVLLLALSEGQQGLLLTDGVSFLKLQISN